MITFRPEFSPPWTGQAHVATLNLSRLGRGKAPSWRDRSPSNNEATPEIMDEIIDAHGRHPALRRGADQGGCRKREFETAMQASHCTANSKLLRVLLSDAARPHSWHARSARPIAKEVAQIGAAIGREFSYEVLAPIAQKTDMEVQTALSRLTDAELVFCRGTPPQATFLFKHALVRDVAYGSLLRGQRQQLHGRIADVLAEHFPTTVEAEPEVIAHHYREAGLADAASTYFERAGDRDAGSLRLHRGDGAFQGSDRGSGSLTSEGGARPTRLNFAAQARTSYCRDDR